MHETRPSSLKTSGLERAGAFDGNSSGNQDLSFFHAQIIILRHFRVTKSYASLAEYSNKGCPIRKFAVLDIMRGHHGQVLYLHRIVLVPPSALQVLHYAVCVPLQHTAASRLQLRENLAECAVSSHRFIPCQHHGAAGPPWRFRRCMDCQCPLTGELNRPGDFTDALVCGNFSPCSVAR
jgi:hypothetical protein